ncbi:MAG: patatin-like phospholipase family protein [Pseudolabrys sp.]|nr:patatin-like phospholipase family protein [Pseudolabrys sp.]
MPIPAYGIFEGGGAKGLGHVAALAAAEANEVEFIGVAGASAGALIASLVAVGYSAKDLFDPNNPQANLLTRHGISPLSLIGVERWRRFRKAKDQAVRFGKVSLAFGTFVGSAFGWSAAKAAWEIKCSGGYFDTATVCKKLNYFLRNKLRDHHARAGRSTNVPDWITFKDIDPTVAPECCTLKVIVTDIVGQRPIVFGSSPDHADVRVAEAVAASIAIPVVFKPARIPSYRNDTGLYADGGLVSNMPIWVFAEEKLNYERTLYQEGRVPVLAFALAADDAASAVSADDLPGLINAVGRSAIFGGQTVVHDFITDLMSVRVPVSLGTTEFEFTQELALNAYYDAHEAAARYLVNEIRIRPSLLADGLKEFHDSVKAIMATHAPEPAVPHLRMSLIRQVGARSFRVMYGYNMKADADDRMSFSALAEGAPDAFAKRRPTLIDYRAIARNPKYPMTKYEMALIRRSLATGICVPIFANSSAWDEKNTECRPIPLGVLCIDSDQDLSHLFENAAIMESLAIESLRLSILF